MMLLLGISEGPELNWISLTTLQGNPKRHLLWAFPLPQWYCHKHLQLPWRHQYVLPPHQGQWQLGTQWGRCLLPTWWAGVLHPEFQPQVLSTSPAWISNSHLQICLQFTQHTWVLIQCNNLWQSVTSNSHGHKGMADLSLQLQPWHHQFMVSHMALQMYCSNLDHQMWSSIGLKICRLRIFKPHKVSRQVPACQHICLGSSNSKPVLR